MTPEQIKQEAERRFPLSNNLKHERFNSEMEYKQAFFISGATWMQEELWQEHLDKLNEIDDELVLLEDVAHFSAGNRISKIRNILKQMMK